MIDFEVLRDEVARHPYCAYKKLTIGAVEDVGVPIRIPSEGW